MAESTPDIVENKKTVAAKSYNLSKGDKKRIAQLLHLLFKNLSIFLFVVNLLAVVWFKADLHPNNLYLSAFDTQNIGKEYRVLSEKKKSLETQLTAKVNALKKLDKKIENEQYLEFQTEIDDIRSDQLVWFDREENGTTVFGMLDAFDRIAAFFNDRNYSDPQKIVSGRKDQIIINDISVNRNQANLSVEVSQILGRVFFLVNEFVDMVNALPFYQNASVTRFAREQNELGDDSMGLSIKLTRQVNPEKDSQNAHPEIDPADSRFEEYLEWLKKTQ